MVRVAICTNNESKGLVAWEINVPFQHKIRYITNKVFGGDLFPLG